MTFEEYWEANGHFGSNPEDVARLAWNAATGAGKDTQRIDKLERILADEIHYNDVLLQSDPEDGVWIALSDKGGHGTFVEDGQDARAVTLRDAIDAVPDRLAKHPESK